MLSKKDQRVVTVYIHKPVVHVVYLLKTICHRSQIRSQASHGLLETSAKCLEADGSEIVRLRSACEDSLPTQMDSRLK